MPIKLGNGLKRELEVQGPYQEPKESEKARAFKRLRSLPPDRLREVERLLMRGVSVTKVSRLIQDTWSYHNDIGLRAMEKCLERYRNEFLNQELLRNLVAAGNVNSLTGELNKLDVIEEMTALAIMQRDRVSRLYGNEKKGRYIDKRIRTESLAYLAILEKLGNLHLEVGILRRAPKMKITEGEMTPTAADPRDPNVITYRVTEQTIAAMDFLEEAAKELGVSLDDDVIEGVVLEGSYSNVVVDDE